jgi:hypothetical protein
MKLKKNMNVKDRLARLFLALVLLLYAYIGHSWLALFFALFTFVEVGFNWCVIYQFFGINHCPLSRK